jgi:hypothetical protein
MDAKTIAALQEILSRESRSFLHYLRDAFPWTTSKGSPALSELKEIIHDEEAAVDALGRFLVCQRIRLAPLGSFPSNFTGSNFLTLEHDLGKLLKSEQNTLQALEKDLPAVTEPQAKALLEDLLTLKRANIAKLQKLLSPTPQTAGA